MRRQLWPLLGGRIVPSWAVSSLALCLGTVAALAGCSRGGTSPEGTPPRIVLTPAILDLGTGAPGEMLTGTVLIGNGGGSPFHVQELRLGCSCLSATLSSPTIPAGQTVTLTVVGRMNPDGKPLSFPVSIFGSSSTEPDSVVQVRAVAAPPPIRPEPAEIDFGLIPLGEAPRRTIRLLDPSGSASFAGQCQLDFEAVPTRVDASIQVVDAGPERSFLLSASPKETSLLGPVMDSLRVRFRSPGKEYSFTVPVRGTVTRRLTVSPNTVCFDGTVRDPQPTRVVVVRRVDGRPLAPLRRIDAPSCVRAEEEGTRDDTSACRRIRLILDHDTTLTKKVEASLVIWIDGEDEPLKVRIAVAGRDQ